MFTHISLIETKPCFFSHLLLMPTCVANVRDRFHGPLRLMAIGMATFFDAPSLSRFRKRNLWGLPLNRDKKHSTLYILQRAEAGVHPYDRYDLFLTSDHRFIHKKALQENSWVK